MLKSVRLTQNGRIGGKIIQSDFKGSLKVVKSIYKIATLNILIDQ